MSEPPEIRAQRAAPLGHESSGGPFATVSDSRPTGIKVSLVRKRIGIRQSLQAMFLSSLIAVSVAALIMVVSLPASSHLARTRSNENGKKP